MAEGIDYKRLQELADAYVMYELATHGVDPREKLDGTVLRKEGSKGEGYKYGIYNKYHERMLTTNSPVNTLLEAMPGVNLVSYHQKKVIEDHIKVNGPDLLEESLTRFYKGDDDPAAFQNIVSLIGGYFDILGFIFFLKDCEKYMPIRSRMFDERFKIIQIDSGLEGNCTWKKYQDYNSWIREVHRFLRKYINKELTLIDTHSFIWVLPGIEKYINSKQQVVQHKKFGKGIITDIREDGSIIARFGEKEMMFLNTVFADGILSIVPNDFNIYLDGDMAVEPQIVSKKTIEVAEALLKLIANRKRLTTYGELSAMTESKPSPYYEMRMLLDSINKICDKIGLPYISAMVVNKSTQLPGDGFRDLCINSFGYDQALSIEEIFNAELDKIGKCSDWDKLAGYFGLEMPTEDEELLPEEVAEEDDAPIIEGAKKTITVNSYERDPKAKRICKDYYMKRDGRLICQICGFDFGEMYGAEYANKIHVHHIVPVSEIGEEYIIDPVEDLIPVCPNCHMILHAGKGISVEALKKKIAERNKKNR